jgi:hypothetical protein
MTRTAHMLRPVAACLAIGAITVMGVTATQPAFAQGVQGPSCTSPTLSGLYIFDATGYIFSATGWVPKAVVESLNFNGDCTLSSIGGANRGRVLVANDHPGTGSYSVNADCTGTLTFNPQGNPPGPHFDIFVAPRGTTLHMDTNRFL